jgi:hypothetical protein
MHKRSGTISRRSPNFDALESRCLLSFGNAGFAAFPRHDFGVPAEIQIQTMNGPGEGMGRPLVPAFPNDFGPGSGPPPSGSGSFVGRPGFPSGSGPASPPGQPPPLSPSPPALAAPAANSQPGSPSTTSPGSQVASGNGLSQSLVQSSGSASNTASGRIRVENPELASGESVQVAHPADRDGAGGDVFAIVIANGAGGSPGNALVSAQIPLAASLATSAATQVEPLSLSGNDVAATVRPETFGDASAHGDRVADLGPNRKPSTWNGPIATFGSHPDVLQGARFRNVNSSRLADARLDDFPGLSGDDLMSVAPPFDRASLERAVDHFFRQLDEFEVRELVGRDLTRVVFVSLGLASTIAALELARRRLGRWTRTGQGTRSRETLVSGNELGFPDLPGSWSSRLT